MQGLELGFGVPPAVGEVTEFLQFGGIGIHGVRRFRIFVKSGRDCRARGRSAEKQKALLGRAF